MNVKIARIKAKIKQKDLAEAVGISREYIRKIENDEANPTRDLMIKIAEALNSTVQELFFFNK